MIKKSIKSSALMAAFAGVLMLGGGSLNEASAQRDPFKKAGWAQPKRVVRPSVATVAKAVVPVSYAPPGIEARIDYYKRLREAAAANGTSLPKVTSVLTLSEMAVTGIFKTPRGYAAMIEATPIKLSYTIYPGEKFFDGQLVAVEENRLVFRKVTKVSEGKFVASIENKPLRQFSMKSQVEGTAPTQPNDKPVEIANNNPAETVKSEQKEGKDPKQTAKDVKPTTNQFVSPLDEMNNLPATPSKTDDKAKKPVKKPVKIAKNGGN